jgi:lysophospholipase L1-like esterase
MKTVRNSRRTLMGICGTIAAVGATTLLILGASACEDAAVQDDSTPAEKAAEHDDNKISVVGSIKGNGLGVETERDNETKTGTAHNEDRNWRWTDLPTNKPFKIVQLGDSYSAGPGAVWGKQGVDILDMSQYENGDAVPGCYNSAGNWARRYAEKLRNSGIDVDFKSYACTGAVTTDIEHVQKSVKNGPGPLPQIENVELNDETDLVFITIGGNDVRFAEVVQNCYVIYNLLPAFPVFDDYADFFAKTVSSCLELLSDDSGTNVYNLKNTLKWSIVATLSKIGKKAPYAKIILVQYPFLDRDIDAGWPLDIFKA